MSAFLTPLLLFRSSCFSLDADFHLASWGSGSYSLEYVVPPITSITEKITSLDGTVTSSLSNDINAGVAAARGKDVAFVFANAMSGELGAYDVVEGNMGDRNDLALWWKGGSLVRLLMFLAGVSPTVDILVGPDRGGSSREQQYRCCDTFGWTSLVSLLVLDQTIEALLIPSSNAVSRGVIIRI